jgi:hypothetical protein
MIVERISSPDELMDQLANMNKENSICQVFIPSKGKFTIVLQEEVERSIADDVKSNPELKKMIHESIEAYHDGKFMSTSELLKSISPKDFNR